MDLTGLLSPLLYMVFLGVAMLAGFFMIVYRLGNDAAHVESQEYASVGQEEEEAGIAVAKELLKAVYQYASVMK